MNRIICLISLLSICLSGLNAQKIINNPPYKTRTSGVTEISRIELSNKDTRVYIHCTYTPHFWVKFSKDMYILDKTSGKRYYPTGIEGTEFSKETYMPDSGDSTIVMIYPPLPSSLKIFDWTCDRDDEWKIFGISLTDENVQKNNGFIPNIIYGNWLKTDGSNEWIYGFYDRFAIIDNDYWNYLSLHRKGKNYILELRKENEKKELTLIPQKDGTCFIGTNINIVKKFSRQKTNDLAYNPQDEDFTEPFFSRDTAYLQGYIQGYDTCLKFNTGIIYLMDAFTHESSPIVAAIDSMGRFNAKLPINHPISNKINFLNNYIPFYIEPGDTLTMLVNWNNILAVEYDKSLSRNELFMGKSARVNKELEYQKEMKFDYSGLHAKAKDSNPDEVKQEALNIYHTYKDSLNALFKRIPISTKAQRLMNNYADITTAMYLMDFDMYRNFNNKDSIKKTIDAEYYSFLKDFPKNENIISIPYEFNFLVNRYEYMQPFEESYSVVLESGKSVAAYLMEEKKKELSAEELATVSLLYKFEQTKDTTIINKDKVGDCKKNNAVYENNSKLYFVFENIKDTTTNKDKIREYNKRVDAILKNKPALNEEYNGKYVMFDYYLKNWQVKDSIVKNVLHLPLGFMHDVAKCRYLKSTFDHSGMNKEYSNKYLTAINKQIKEPFLREEGRRLYKEAFPENASKAYKLPEGKGTDIFKTFIDKHKGKYVIVDFWATTCGPCCYGIKQSRDVREKYKDSNDLAFVFITDERSSPINTYNKFVSENAMGGNIYRISEDQYNYLRQLFKFNGIPHYVLIDREGNVLDDNMNTFNLEDEINEIIIDNYNK